MSAWAATALLTASKGNPMSVVYPTDGAVLCIGPSGVLANAPHPTLCWLFMNWLLSADCAMVLADNFQTPVRDDVPPNAATKPVSQVKLMRDHRRNRQGRTQAICDWRSTRLQLTRMPSIAGPRRFDPTPLLWIAIAAVLVFLVVNLLARLAITSLQTADTGVFTFQNYITAYGRLRYRESRGTRWNSAHRPPSLCLLIMPLAHGGAHRHAGQGRFRAAAALGGL